MSRAEIIETMARAIFCAAWGEYAWGQPGTTDLERREVRQQATAALSALEYAGLAVVPVEPSDQMIDAAMWADKPPKAIIEDALRAEWKAQIAAAHGAHKP